jgi:hypothetical protein
MQFNYYTWMFFTAWHPIATYMSWGVSNKYHCHCHCHWGFNFNEEWFIIWLFENHLSVKLYTDQNYTQISDISLSRLYVKNSRTHCRIKHRKTFNSNVNIMQLKMITQCSHASHEPNSAVWNTLFVLQFWVPTNHHLIR